MSNHILERFREYINPTQFNAIRISLASPEKIRMLSYGEVKKMETINYRTLKPERDGLFCARIFGPTKDWECNCGKYKRMKHRGVTCEKCGVEVIQSRVRRERMGHIDLMAPVCHIWYLKSIPSYLGMVLDAPIKDLERVVYFDAYMVVNQGKSPYARGSLLNNSEYEQYRERHVEDLEFLAQSGAEALRSVLKIMDLDLDIKKLREEYEKSTSITVRHKLIRRIKVLSDFLHSNLRPELMILEVLPVLPPDLRPLVPLEGGRFASSDFNELYRRLLNRNIRLKRLMEINAPEVIIRNEKRMLQESVDALIDNGRRGQPVRGTNKRPLKSLSEMLRGKQGRFRQNLLGRRVDYSGRSVIVVAPELKLNQCGLPKLMALELFKPFILGELIKREIAPNMHVAKRLIEQHAPEVWDALEDIVANRPVMLNRAPTLHRLGIQAFYPILVDGKAIKIHPLVCSAYNADFDGDMMAVHVPLSKKAVAECKELILSTKNLLSPANGKPLAIPSQDMVLGIHYMTKMRRNLRGQDTVFASLDAVISAYQSGAIDLHAQIKVRLLNNKIVDTSVGRSILYSILPKDIDFSYINRAMTKQDIAKLVENIHFDYGDDVTVRVLDDLKKIGFSYSTKAGVSALISDLVIAPKKNELIEKAEQEVNEVERLYMDGAITNGERKSKIIGIWGAITSQVTKEMDDAFEQQNELAYLNADNSSTPFNSVFMMLQSAARGNKSQIKQLVGMRGLMAKPSGEVIETPVKSNFKDGLSVFEYFISTHGARKGQADTALKTANSGYLTRRLVDVAQDVVITMINCNTAGFSELFEIKESGNIIYSLTKRVFGRVLAADLIDDLTGKIILRFGTLIDKVASDKISDSNATKASVRSVLNCQSKRGVCAECYGMDLSRGRLVDIGTTVGIIAAQSIGEPGTQLTMRTFHIGGTANVLASDSSATAKYDGRVEWRGMRVITNRAGQSVVLSRKGKLVILSNDGRVLQEQLVEYGYTVLVKDGINVKVGDLLLEWDNSSRVLITESAGYVRYVDLIENVTLEETTDSSKGSNRLILENREERYQPALSIVDEDGTEMAHYYLPTGSYLAVGPNQKLEVGDIIVKMPRDVSKTKDITGGLPRIAELFEARLPKNPAILAEVDGEVVVGGLHRGQRKISVVSGEQTFDYLVPRGKQLTVFTGDKVSAGDQLTAGEPVLQDLLSILGSDHVERYLVSQIQEIYRLNGIDINDRHIEVIVRQMLRKVRVVDPGETDFLVGDRVDRIHFRMVNNLLRSEGKRPATARSVLMGITMASLGTESVLSAASFQETTRILAEAAVAGKVDYLYGLKENVIIGKVIPAGTGIPSYREKYIGKELSDIN